MKREDFINWLKNETCFGCWGVDDNDDNVWRYEVDYANGVWDTLNVWDNNVTFCWEEMYWGGSNYNSKDYGFEEFIEAYKNDTYKY